MPVKNQVFEKCGCVKLNEAFFFGAGGRQMGP